MKVEGSNEMSASSVGGIFFLQWYGMSLVCMCEKWAPGLQLTVNMFNKQLWTVNKELFSCMEVGQRNIPFLP
jgi:hypothetical protein